MEQINLKKHLPAFGLGIVLIWIGLMKFTSYEANAIQGLIANSPLMSWMYSIFSVEATSTLIGLSELGIAALLFAKPWNPKLAMFGGLAAAGTFATTLSFLFSTPGVWEASLGGFPALSVMPGQFLIKDIALLSIALWVALDNSKEEA